MLYFSPKSLATFLSCTLIGYSYTIVVQKLHMFNFFCRVRFVDTTAFCTILNVHMVRHVV